MLKGLLATGIRRFLQQLAQNPTHLALVLVVDGKEHFIASIDEHRVRALLQLPGHARKLRAYRGVTRFDIDL